MEIFKSRDIDEITQGEDVGDKDLKFGNKALGRGITRAGHRHWPIRSDVRGKLKRGSSRPPSMLD